MKRIAILITLFFSVAFISGLSVAIDIDDKQYNIDSSYDIDEKKSNGSDDTESLDVKDPVFSNPSKRNSYVSNVTPLLLLKTCSPYTPRAPPANLA
jgi:hypothetical protein